MNVWFSWFGLPGTLVLTSLMSILSVVLAIIFPSAQRFLSIPGMLLWSLGDIILMDYRPVTDKLPVKGFVAGGLAFFAGHMFFTASFITVMIRNGVGIPNIGTAVGICLYVICCTLLSVFSRGRKGRSMLLLFCLYIGALAIVGTAADSVAYALGGRYILSAVGVISFIVSDMLIGFDNVCGMTFPAQDRLVWTFYPIGVILILIGI